MSKELPKAYNPGDYEDAIYQEWEKSGFFNPDNLAGEPYSIMMPPPNVTGVLHLGHALENSLMDIMARYQRMNGKKVLLLPGTDHAAVATQAKVEKILVEQGVTNPRQELGREKLLEKIREYAESSKTTILKQIRKMGTSCDWSRLAYTFDETRGRAVNEVFIKMYNDGLIYRGNRAVNWSVKGQSTCSDDELVYIERPAKLYTFKYSKDFPLAVATTRPETKLGDTAVAVNPKDKRYKKYIGQIFTVEVGAARPLELKIIADENVETEFGTGAVGVTPAHSLADFEIYEKQKAKGEPIGLVQVIGQNGKMTAEAGAEYSGLPVNEARKNFINWLKKNGLMEKEEEISQNVGTADRFGDAVEILPMTQWFIDVDKNIPGKNKTLKDLMREAVTIGHNGDAKQKVKITPERFAKVYLNWIDNLRDWCISRQIWWGHRIPVYYHKQGIFNFQFPIFNEMQNAKFWELKIYGQDIFEGLMNGTKKIEIRAGRPRGTGDKYWGEIKPGDIIEFSLADEKTDTIIKAVPPVKKIVKSVRQFKTIDQLLEKYKAEDDYPGKTATDLKKWWQNRPALYDRVKKYGIWVIELSEFSEQKIYVGVEKPEGEGWIQDEDTLDTWFSSGLWTFSTLGWPEKSPLPPLPSERTRSVRAGVKGGKSDLKTFHPTSWMQMGYEILFFWLARMILMSTYALDQIPFKDVYIHGMLRNELGKKFSKSSGDNVDPLEVAAKYGMDALRLSLISGITPGNDSRFYEEKVEGARNMVNKLWNVARYIIGNWKLEIGNLEINKKDLTLADKWILGKMKKLIGEVTNDLENYEFSRAGEKLREFNWDDLADWYLEISKFEKGKKEILYFILENLLKLWHPFMPFVTEVLWQEMGHKKLLIIEKWPLKSPLPPFVKGGYSDFEVVKEIITAIRNARSENKVEPARKVKAVIYAGKNKKLIEAQAQLIKNLRTGLSELEVSADGEKLTNAIYAAVGEIEIYLIGAVDSEKEKVRLKKEVANLEKIIKVTKNRLNNKEFMAKAPEAVVKKEKGKLKGWQAELKKLKSR